MPFEVVVHLGPAEQVLWDQSVQAMQHFATGLDRLATVAEAVSGGQQAAVDTLVARLRAQNVKLADEVAAHLKPSPPTP